MIYLLFKSINPYTRIGVSNLKYEIDKSTLSKFGSNLKDIIDDMSSNYTIIIDGVKYHKDCVRHPLRDLLSGKNSTFNNFIERTNDDWGTVSEFLS